MWRSWKRAEADVKEGRIVKLTTPDGSISIYLYVASERGRHNDHVINGKHCDCESFLFNHVLKEGEPCVHIKAFLKATEGENYVKLVLSKTELKEILTEYTFTENP